MFSQSRAAPLCRYCTVNFDSTINVRAKSPYLGVPEDVGGARRGKAEVGVRGQAALPRSVDAP